MSMNPKTILAAFGIDLNEVEENVKRIVSETQSQIQVLHTKMDVIAFELSELKKQIEASNNGRTNAGNHHRRNKDSDGATITTTNGK